MTQRHNPILIVLTKCCRDPFFRGKTVTILTISAASPLRVGLGKECFWNGWRQDRDLVEGEIRADLPCKSPCVGIYYRMNQPARAKGLNEVVDKMVTSLVATWPYAENIETISLAGVS